ncbi:MULTISPECIES: hypothetical protein [Bremerella]|uniref:hypothetical protein n=1 Tax=Bremerella TaxID=2714594 RepID=UPI0031EF8308
MPNSTRQNPFQSPKTSSEEIQSENDVAAQKAMPTLVAIIWMLYTIVGFLHIGVGLVEGNILQGIVGCGSCLIGFLVLYPSIIAWLGGIGYATLMAVLSVGVVTAGYVENSMLLVIGVPPLVIYLAIMVLLIQTSTHYYLRRR